MAQVSGIYMPPALSKFGHGGRGRYLPQLAGLHTVSRLLAQFTRVSTALQISNGN